MITEVKDTMSDLAVRQLAAQMYRDRVNGKGEWAQGKNARQWAREAIAMAEAFRAEWDRRGGDR